MPKIICFMIIYACFFSVSEVCAHVQSARVEIFGSKRSNMVSLVHRYRGALLATKSKSQRMYSKGLRNKTTKQLLVELRDIKLIARDYKILNRRFMPSIAGPITLGAIGGIGYIVCMPLFIVSIFYYDDRPLPPGAVRVNPYFVGGLISVGIGSAFILCGMIWFFAQMYKRRYTPFYNVIRKWKNRYNMIRREIKARRHRRIRSGLLLPRVFSQKLAFSF